MKKVHGLAATKAWLAALCISLISLIGISHAQSDLSAFAGRFTLTQPTQWDSAVLQPGSYTVRIWSHGGETFALVRDSKGRSVGIFRSGIDEGKRCSENALLIGEKGGQLRVYSLALASLGRVLVYDAALARKAALEARSRASQTVPVMVAKR